MAASLGAKSVKMGPAWRLRYAMSDGGSSGSTERSSDSCGVFAMICAAGQRA